MQGPPAVGHVCDNLVPLKYHAGIQSESFHMRAGAAGCAHKLYGPHLLQGGALVPAASHATAFCCPLLTPPHVDSKRSLCALHACCQNQAFCQPPGGARQVLGQGAVHGAFAGYTGFTVGLLNTHYAFLPIPVIIQARSRLLSLAACSVAGCSSPSCAVCLADKPRISRHTRQTGQLVGAVLKALCRVIALQRCLPHPN